MKRPVFRSLKSRRMAARRGFRLSHDRLPLAFGSLCARLAAFHFEIKAEMNADDPCESPAEHPPERDSIAPYSPASNFAMASRNASP